MEITPIPGFSEPFSSISHLGAAITSFIGSFFLITRGRGNSNRVIGLVIYTCCLIFLFSMSGVYHLLEKGGSPNYVLRILDHVGIYLMIAGSFTPLHLILFRGVHRWLVLLIVWTLAITGLTLTAIYFDSIPNWLGLTFFLSLGWFGLVTLYKMYELHSRWLLKYLSFGGLSYTFGAIYEFVKGPTLIEGIIGPHEVFHIFVILGAAFHWRLIYRISKYPISSKITVIVRQFPNRVTAEATSEHMFIEGQSRDEVKDKVLNWVDEMFHYDMRPKYITFKFREEEFIHLEN